MVLTIPEKVSVESEKKVRLSDIAKTDSQSQKIAGIIVHDEIKPGKISYLYKTQIESALKDYGISDVTIYMKNRVELEGSFYEFSEDKASELIFDYLKKKRPDEKFELKRLILVGSRKFPSKNFDYVDLNFKSDEINPGNNRGEITLFSGGEESVIKFMAFFSKEVEMVCASRDLSRGSIVGFNDLEIKTFSLEMEKGDYFSEKRFLVGKELRKNYDKGEVITSAMTFRPSLINRGDEIQIAAVSDGVSVVTRGEALQNGHLGDRIIVRNLKSGKELRGEIISSNSVKVSF
jgi:flagella basal body P-ring formation protein FlgA